VVRKVRELSGFDPAHKEDRRQLQATFWHRWDDAGFDLVERGRAAAIILGREADAAAARGAAQWLRQWYVQERIPEMVRTAEALELYRALDLLAAGEPLEGGALTAGSGVPTPEWQNEQGEKNAPSRSTDTNARPAYKHARSTGNTPRATVVLR
jgi:hypothetical protein